MTFVELNDLYQEFKNKYNGKYTDYDGAYGAQCWDLAQRFFVEYLGVPEYVLSGSGLVSNMLYEPKRSQLLEYFDEIPVNSMCPGDVVIWEWGHIALFDRYDGANWYFSQNPNPCQVMNVRQDGHHAFRLKGVSQAEPPNFDTPTTTEEMKVLNKQIDDLKIANDTLTKQVDTLLVQIEELTKNQPKQVFKCPKSGMYKIRLDKDETLYIG